MDGRLCGFAVRDAMATTRADSATLSTVSGLRSRQADLKVRLYEHVCAIDEARSPAFVEADTFLTVQQLVVRGRRSSGSAWAFVPWLPATAGGVGAVGFRLQPEDPVSFRLKAEATAPWCSSRRRPSGRPGWMGGSAALRFVMRWRRRGPLSELSYNDYAGPQCDVLAVRSALTPGGPEGPPLRTRARDRRSPEPGVRRGRPSGSGWALVPWLPASAGRSGLLPPEGGSHSSLVFFT